MYKSDKGIISGKVERFKEYVDYKTYMINSNTHIKPNYQVNLANLHYLITLQKRLLSLKTIS